MDTERSSQSVLSKFEKGLLAERRVPSSLLRVIAASCASDSDISLAEKVLVSWTEKDEDTESGKDEETESGIIGCYSDTGTVAEEATEPEVILVFEF